MLFVVAFFITVAWLAREVQGMRDRVTTDRAMGSLRLAHQKTRHSLKRVAEDFFAVQRVLLEQNIIAQPDAARAHVQGHAQRNSEQQQWLFKQINQKQICSLVTDREGNIH